jgi:hypothetical protein
MSRPIRVEEWAYPRGARVNLRLRFRSQNHYDKVAAEFYNSSGQVIRVEGTSHPSEKSGVAHTDVVLTGRISESAALGTYRCRSVQGASAGGREWTPIFEDPAFNIRVVERSFHAQRGAEFLGLEPA